jgi:hypothetical protein
MRARPAIVPLAGLAWAAVALLGPATASAQEAPGLPAEDQVVLSGSVRVPRGEAVGEVLVFSGSVRVDGVVRGDVVVLEGPVVVNGQVNGSVIAADGQVTLRESARVGGDVSSSAPVVADAGARVRGEVRDGIRFSLEGPLSALGDLLGPVAIAVSVLFTGLVLLVLAPRGADAVAEALGSAPMSSLAWGVLVVVGVPLVAVALAVLVLGLPLGLALLLSLGLWWIVGLTFAAWSAGRSLVRSPHGRLPAFLAGWAVLSAVGLVPSLNVAVWILASVIGLGAAVVATWRARDGAFGGRHRRRGAAPEDVEAGFA